MAENSDAEQLFTNGLDCLAMKDYARAVSIFREGAEQGDAGAQYFLGELYEDGKGVRQNLKEAAYWYTKAAEQGHAVAQNNLGTLYFNGTGVFKNRTKAHWLHTQAAEQGDDAAARNLSRLDYEDTFLRVYSVIGIILLGGISWALFDLIGLIGGAIAGWIIGRKMGQIIRKI